MLLQFSSVPPTFAYWTIHDEMSVPSHLMNEFVCKRSSHTFIYESVTMDENAFIGHGMSLTNNSYPRATDADGNQQIETD